MPADHDTVRDLVGIGAGPLNLSLAALAHGVPGLETAFYDQRPRFQWHPGLLIEDATLQVPFLADLVTLADPTSPYSFLNYLRSRDRLYPFYFAERFHIHRAEYDAYCRWVSERLPELRFGHRAEAVRWDAEQCLFDVAVTRLGAGGDVSTHGCTHVWARHLALGVGTEPYVPEALRHLAGAPGTPSAHGVPVLHAADYLGHRDRLLAAGHVTVVGAGQSGAEVFLDLLRARPAGAERLHWLARTPAFAPMEYSKLGLEQFTPDYTRYFHGLPDGVRDGLLPRQWQLYKAVDAATLGAVHDELYRRTLDGGWPDAVLTPAVEVRSATRGRRGRLELRLHHTQQGTRGRLTTDAVVLATGYRERPLDALLAPLGGLVRRDAAGRPRVDRRHRLELDPAVAGSGGPPGSRRRHIYVQSADRHTHGVGAPDLGLAAHRGAAILNDLTGTNAYPLPRRTAFTTFGLSPTDEPADERADEEGSSSAVPGTVRA